MGCGSSTPQAEGNNKESNNNNKLSSFIRRRFESIRRRRRRNNRVGDVVTMEASLSFNVLIKDDDRSSAHTSINNSDWGKNVVVDSVLRAIEELVLSEEREYGALLNDDGDDKISGVFKHMPQSPSFRVYCTRLNSFDSCSSKDNNDFDHEAAVVKDVAKTKRGRCKSMDTASSVMSSEEEEESSRKGKTEGRQKCEITKKTLSNWKLASPLGMTKNLFVMSCYSCSPYNRDRFLSRG